MTELKRTELSVHRERAILVAVLVKNTDLFEGEDIYPALKEALVRVVQAKNNWKKTGVLSKAGLPIFVVDFAM